MSVQAKAPPLIGTALSSQRTVLASKLSAKRLREPAARPRLGVNGIDSTVPGDGSSLGRGTSSVSTVSLVYLAGLLWGRSIRLRSATHFVFPVLRTITSQPR